LKIAVSVALLTIALLLFIVLYRVPHPAGPAGRVEDGGTLEACTDPSRCPVGFCYWRSIHGPFWQRTDASIPPESPSFRGSALRIYIEGGSWQWKLVSDATGMEPAPQPGGAIECTLFREITALADPATCFSVASAVSEPGGSAVALAAEVGGSGVHVLTGFVGNVAQAADDSLRLVAQGGQVQLTQRRGEPPRPAEQLGPASGEAWTSVCAGWTPELLAQDVLSTADVQLVPFPQSRAARCYITGIRGVWSRAGGDGGQPRAEIYRGAEQDLRLRVAPSGERPDGVGAYATCFRLR
jgi:hypothetical protein